MLESFSFLNGLKYGHLFVEEDLTLIRREVNIVLIYSANQIDLTYILRQPIRAKRTGLHSEVDHTERVLDGIEAAVYLIDQLRELRRVEGPLVEEEEMVRGRFARVRFRL
jgi:hypothetical protein